MSKNLFITELFMNQQGEGVFAGTPSFFVRTGGCSVKCPGCDTIYSWNKKMELYDQIETDNIIMQIVESNLRHVVFTGGEPTDQIDAVMEVAQSPHLKNCFFTIETAGTNDFDPKPFHLLSFSPKMKGMMKRVISTEKYGHFSNLIERCYEHKKYVQLKFVIESKDDYQESKDFIQNCVPQRFRKSISLVYQPNNQIYREFKDNKIQMYLNSLKILNEQVLNDFQRGDYAEIPNVRVLPQNHLLMYGGEKGK